MADRRGRLISPGREPQAPRRHSEPERRGAGPPAGAVGRRHPGQPAAVRQLPRSYVRHANFTSVRIDANVSPEDDSKFRIVKGLADNAGYVSFASVNQPGYYLRQKNFAFELAPYDGSPQFAADATFAEVPGLADTTGSSFQSYSQPNYYMRHYAYQLRLDTIGGDATSRSDATFRVTD
nr:AbfB domain-containing protein [Paracidovorax cattleyae]